MAKANQLQDLLQQIEELIADLADPNDQQIEELPDSADQNLNAVRKQISGQDDRPQA